jgi:hypothetical protein
MTHFVTDSPDVTNDLVTLQWVSQRGGEEGLRTQSQEGQDLSADVAVEELNFKLGMVVQ